MCTPSKQEVYFMHYIFIHNIQHIKKNEVSAYYEQDATHARSRTAIAPDSFFNEGINVWSQKDQTSFLHNN